MRNFGVSLFAFFFVAVALADAIAPRTPPPSKTSRTTAAKKAPVAPPAKQGNAFISPAKQKNAPTLDERNPFGISFRTATRTMLTSVKSAGFTKIGKIPVDSLIERSAKTEWHSTKVFMAAGEKGNRMSGATLVQENAVIFGLPFMDAYQKGAIHPDPLNIFALHEALGAIGIEDTNYSLSLSIAYLGFLSSHLSNDDIRALFRERIADAQSFNLNKRVLFANGNGGGGKGGGSGVGGGGDFAAIDVKFKLLEGLAFKLPRAPYRATPRAFAEKVLALNVRVNYESAPPTLTKDKRGNYTLTVTHNDWFDGDANARYEYQMKVLARVVIAFGDIDTAVVNPEVGVEE